MMMNNSFDANKNASSGLISNSSYRNMFGLAHTESTALPMNLLDSGRKGRNLFSL